MHCSLWPEIYYFLSQAPNLKGLHYPGKLGQCTIAHFPGAYLGINISCQTKPWQAIAKQGCIHRMVRGSSVHKLLGNFSATSGFSATFSLLSNFQCIRQLLSFCVSIVTVMLLLRVKQLKSAEYKNIACVENIFVQSFSLLLGGICFHEKVSLRNRKLQ